MNIVDTHLHIWDFSKADYPWLAGNTTLMNRTYGVEELEAERRIAGITQGILVQAANNRQDTDWMLTVAGRVSWISGVVGWVPLLQPAATATALDQLQQNSYLKGIRHLIHDEPDPGWLLQPAVLESLQLLAARNLGYDVVGTMPEHLEGAIAVAQRIPGLRLMLDHLNQPPPAGTKAWDRWCGLVKTAAACPNLYAKISGLGTTTGKSNWTAADILPAVEQVVQAFGAERCCLGGDWPVSLLAGTYTHTWAQYKAALTSVNGSDSWESVFFTTAKNFYQL